MKRLLFVCSGNTCRSPMAKAIMQQLLENVNDQEIAVESAGLFTSNGMPASEAARVVMNEIGLDLSDHSSQVVSEGLIAKAELILTMTKEHCRLMRALYPQKEYQIFTLGEFIGQPALEISDPFGRDLDTYRKSQQELKEILTLVMNILFEEK